jgi:epoxide hydrolase-like predicted phosphatase
VTPGGVDDRRRPVARGHRGLLLDYGGVLTTPVTASFASFEQQAGIPAGRVVALLVAASRSDDGGLIGALERGELAVDRFEAALAELLTSDGHRVPAGPLLAGLFATLRPDGPLWDLAVRARAAGHRTGVLSNSWGTGLYDHERLAAAFDVVVISGEVGLRKPDPAIYRLAADRLDLPPTDVVFVDDLEHNVDVARRVGMAGVLHTGDGAVTAATVAALHGLAWP